MMKRNPILDFFCWIFYEDHYEEITVVLIWLLGVIIPIVFFIAGFFSGFLFLGIPASYLMLYGVSLLEKYWDEREEDEDNPW